MHSERTTLDLVGSIYDAVGEPALCPDFLQQFADACRARVATLYVQDLRTHQGASESVIGMDSAYNRSYQSYYAPKNIYLIRGQHLLRTGNVVCSEELCPNEEVLSSEFYNDWVQPQKLRDGLNGVLFNERSLVGSRRESLQ